MVVGAVVLVALVIVVLAAIGSVPFLLVLPAAGILLAVTIGYLMNRQSRPGGP